jgi:hypothetical protein
MMCQIYSQAEMVITWLGIGFESTLGKIMGFKVPDATASFESYHHSLESFALCFSRLAERFCRQLSTGATSLKRFRSGYVHEHFSLMLQRLLGLDRTEYLVVPHSTGMTSGEAEKQSNEVYLFTLRLDMEFLLVSDPCVG